MEPSLSQPEAWKYDVAPRSGPSSTMRQGSGPGGEGGGGGGARLLAALASAHSSGRRNVALGIFCRGRQWPARLIRGRFECGDQSPRRDAARASAALSAHCTCSRRFALRWRARGARVSAQRQLRTPLAAGASLPLLVPRLPGVVLALTRSVHGGRVRARFLAARAPVQRLPPRQPAGARPPRALRRSPARPPRALRRSPARRAMRFRLKTEFLTYAHSQIRGGLWYKPTWWEAVQRVPPCAVLPRPRKSTIPRLRFVEDALMRCVAAAWAQALVRTRAGRPTATFFFVLPRSLPRCPPHFQLAASSPRATPRCAPWTRATLRAGAQRRWRPSLCLRSCAT